MHFRLIDTVCECSAERIVATKTVTLAEEYLRDHFPSFPVLPGVLMLESLVHSARHLLMQRDPALSRHVLGSVRALKYASFVQPGDTLRVEVALLDHADSVFRFKGSGTVARGGGAGEAENTVSGRFSLRPPTVRTGPREPSQNNDAA